MKSRTLCCNKTVIWKDITRFAPLWAIYFIGGLLVLLPQLSESRYDEAAYFLAATIGPFAIINMIYAALCAQLLFGDLFNSRLCNALHAMPMRREAWFISHLISGLLFSLVPHLVALPLMIGACGKLWFIPLVWFLGMLLSFLFFFGLAVFSMFCTGNRFAMVAVYGILNFASMIAFWFWETLYAPLMYGVNFDIEQFITFSPVVKLANLVVDESGFVIMEHRLTDRFFHEYRYIYQGLGSAWWYLAVLAVLGLVFAGVALLLYRRRALETAGDFIAVNPLKPVFTIVFSLCSGCVFALFGNLFSVDITETVFLIIGLAVGYFASQMMLQRMVKVFNKKAFFRLGIMALVLVGSLVFVGIDPFGVVSYVPDVQDVAYAEFDYGSDIRENSSNYLKIESDESVEKLINAHEKLLDEHSSYGRTVTLRYWLNNGNFVTRTYRMQTNGGTARTLVEALYSDSKNILGYLDWGTFMASVEDIYINGIESRQLVGEDAFLELLESIRFDADAGQFGDSWGKDDRYLCYISIQLTNGNRGMEVFDCATHTAQWIEKYQSLFGVNTRE